MKQFPVKDFPLLKNKKIIYLDNASTTQKPRSVIDAVTNFYTESNANIGRGIYPLAEKATELYEQARETIAHYINAHPHEIIFTKNATEGINFVAQSWARENLKKGDEIVVTELEHHANLLPWQRIAQQTGAVLRFIPIDNHGALVMSNLEKIITSRTKLVAVTSSSNALGTIVDIRTIINQAKNVDALVLVDACQTVPHQKIDVRKMGTDFLVFSGHKMLGPTGIGVLYIREHLHSVIEPYALGGGIVSEADFDSTTFLKAPQKYEAGTPPIAQAIGLAAAIEYLDKVDLLALQKQEAALCSRLIEGLQKIPKVMILGPIEQLKKNGHQVSFTINGIHAHDVAAFLGQRGICVRAGHFCAQPLAKKMGYDAAVRVSFYGYNGLEDVEALLLATADLVSS